MKIRDTVTHLLAKIPKTLVIMPILFVVFISIALLFTFTVFRNTRQSQPPSSSHATNPSQEKEPAAIAPKTVQGVGGVSLPEDPQ